MRDRRVRVDKCDLCRWLQMVLRSFDEIDFGDVDRSVLSRKVE